MPTDQPAPGDTGPSADPRPEDQRPAVVVLEPVRDLTREVGAVVFLTIGSLLPLVGWVVGTVLLWSSDRWRVWHKMVATLVWPFGYSGVFFLVTSPSQICTTVDASTSCTGSTVPAWAVIPLLVVLIGGPLLVASLLMVVAASRRRIELLRRARLLERMA